MSTTDRTESLYDSPSSPVDADEASSQQSIPQQSIPEAVRDSAHPVQAPSIVQAPVDQAPSGPATAAQRSPDVPMPASQPSAPQASPRDFAPGEPAPTPPTQPSAFSTPERHGGPSHGQPSDAGGPLGWPGAHQLGHGSYDRPDAPHISGTPRRAAHSVSFNEPVGPQAQVRDEDAAEPAQGQVTAASAVQEGERVQATARSEQTRPLPGPEQTRPLPGPAEQEVARPEAQQREAGQREAEQREAEQRARERAERDRRLGTVHPEEQQADVVAPTIPKPTTDRFAGSVGLFVLRLVTAALVGVYGFQALTQRQPVIDTVARIGVPQANLVSWGFAGLLLLVALMVLFGFGTRVAGFVMAALAVVSLVFVKWGAFNPFRAGQAGFSGDIDLLLVGIGWALLFVGAGGWSLDAGMRRSRAKSKLDNGL
ncbi:Uncharacterized membrane protein YphA, DoxX/SURF4 family [Propionibacterium cyclohexanicum]|uniref:Uncharacterized membrane protein YphA, DoxX/SURF4 family n=1 Tax=Propionibacterium cyclohexanicum TaxID=64702 RepID=A0A1H9RVQ0_9ACTN|nr:Uncharacterized membrane protein YphA, DoxX/SURF4 family [Propionibacterium cyclohexanicum]